MGVFQSERFALKLHRTQTNNYGLTKNRQPHKAVKQHLLGLPLNDFKQNIKHRSAICKKELVFNMLETSI